MAPLNKVPKIVCRVIGGGGTALALYAAYDNAKRTSKACSRNTKTQYLTQASSDSLTISHNDINDRNIADKTFNARTRNPIPGIWGKVKGAIQGTLSSFGNNLILITSSAFALLAKGNMAKAGAIGVGVTALYSVLTNGLGFGKESPLD